MYRIILAYFHTELLLVFWLFFFSRTFTVEWKDTAHTNGTTATTINQNKNELSPLLYSIATEKKTRGGRRCGGGGGGGVSDDGDSRQKKLNPIGRPDILKTITKHTPPINRSNGNYIWKKSKQICLCFSTNDDFVMNFARCVLILLHNFRFVDTLDALCTGLKLAVRINILFYFIYLSRCWISHRK